MNKKHLLILLLVLILTVTSVSLFACNTNKGNDKNEEGLTTTLDPNVPIGTSITVKYKSSHSTYGYVEGESTQTIQYGKSKTSTVTAVANLGYKFVSWSDGVTEATRSGESPSKSGDIVAEFALDTKELPILMINTEGGVEITSKNSYVGGKISVFNVEDEYLIDSLDLQIRGRGNYTWDSTFNRDEMYNKRPYRIKLAEQQ